MSSLLHPIHSASQKLRPKHQVLVLKCYPKYQKNVQEIKPNASELSYLLYYASTRRSKLQKVGAFLEKKTASDVWRNKLGNVQVTFQILTALIEKVPRDLSLYSSFVLKVLDLVLRSKDINMVEESIPTWEAYCKHVDANSLAADQHRSQQMLSIVQLYAEFGSKEQPRVPRSGQSLSIGLRWRTVALRAIRAVVGSDAIVAESARLLNMVMPTILDNLSLEENDILSALQQRAQTGEKQDTENARKRRMSIATVTTVDTVDANPATASETTADADKRAEDDVRVLAVRCLKQIFSLGTGVNRGQTRLATAITLRFIASKVPARNKSQSQLSSKPETWATSLFEAIARWTPVQDRFVIVVTAMETLVRSPIVEPVLDKQLVLANMIDWLLSSDINLIGLSVMDVLLGLIHHTLLLLQLGGRDSKITPHYQQADVIGIYREAKEMFDPGSILVEVDRGRQLVSKETSPSLVRQELLAALQKCISNLGTHIYYSDQITDMMTAILARLKPSFQSDIGSSAAAINDPAGTTKAIKESANLQEDPTTDGFFSFATARIIALRSIKDIIIKANNRRTSAGAAVESRSRVGVQVWDGTQWLLKDEDENVRIAYIDALLTWLRLETNKNDQLLPKDGAKKVKSKKETTENGDAKAAKRAVSSASKREPKPPKTTFYQLLHLAIHDNTLDLANSESDILILYLLLTTMVEKLGVNALRTGLPMMARLQESALNSDTKSSQEKVHLASLVHGYFWSIAEKFDFETSRAGNEVNAEISRRKRFSVWFDKVKFPAVAIDHITNGNLVDEKTRPIVEAHVGTIKPFLNLTDFVNEIATAYDNALLTPPNSPPSSPGRVFSVPTLGFGYGYGFAPTPRPSPEDQLPQKIKDEMCSAWSRESCIAAVERESAGSIAGSRTGASSGPRHLAVNGNQDVSTSGRESPASPTEPPPMQGLSSGLGSLQKDRRLSTTGSPVPYTTTSSRDSTMRVTDLKRALSNYKGGHRNQSPLRRLLPSSRRSNHSKDSDSMVSWNDADDRDLSTADLHNGALDAVNESTGPRTASSKRDRASSQISVHDQATLAHDTSDPRLGDDVPPVPRIPSILNLPGTWPRDASPVRPAPPEAASSPQVTAIATDAPAKFRSSQRPVSPKGGRGMGRTSRPASRGTASSTWNDQQSGSGKVDVDKLLAGIHIGNDAADMDKGKVSSRIVKPPY